MQKAMTTVETMRDQKQDRQLLSQRSHDEFDAHNEVFFGTLITSQVISINVI